MINFQILFTFSEKEKQQLYFRKKAELSSAFLLVQKKYLLYIMIPYLYRKTESIEYTVFHSSYFVRDSMFRKRGCEITLSTEKEDFSFKMNERSSFMLKLTCDENFNYKL